MSNQKDMKLIMEGWRAFIKEEEQKDPAAEEVFKDIANITAQELKNSQGEIEAKIQQGQKSGQQNKTGVVQEEGFLLATSIALAAPSILKIISKVAKAIGKKFGAKMKDENFLDHLAHDLHEGYIGAIEKVISLFPSFKGLNSDQKRKMAEAIFNCIIAYLMIQSGAGALKAAKAGHVVHAGVESALTAIKNGELAAFVTSTLSNIAKT